MCSPDTSGFFPSGITCPADSVHVVLDGPGQVEVDHRRDVGHVQAPGRHVGRNQHRDSAELEVPDRLIPCVLKLVAMDGRGVNHRAVVPDGT